MDGSGQRVTDPIPAPDHLNLDTDRWRVVHQPGSFRLQRKHEGFSVDIDCEFRRPAPVDAKQQKTILARLEVLGDSLVERLIHSVQIARTLIRTRLYVDCYVDRLLVATEDSAQLEACAPLICQYDKLVIARRDVNCVCHFVLLSRV